MAGTRWHDVSWGAAGILVFLAAWEIASRSGIVTPTLAPPPSHIPAAFLREIANGEWQATVVASLRHYALGVFLGTIGGIAFGLAVAIFPRFAAALAGIVRILRPIPPLAWIPFAIIWFGVSETAAALVIAIGVFWLNYFATVGAVEVVDPRFLELARAFGHQGLAARLIKIILPAASPGILAGIRAGIGQGWMAVVAAELFGIPGIGQRMMEAAGLLATDIVVLYMLTIALLYALSDMIFARFSARLLAWTK